MHPCDNFLLHVLSRFLLGTRTSSLISCAMITFCGVMTFQNFEDLTNDVTAGERLGANTLLASFSTQFRWARL